MRNRGSRDASPFASTATEVRCPPYKPYPGALSCLDAEDGFWDPTARPRAISASDECSHTAQEQAPEDRQHQSTEGLEDGAAFAEGTDEHISLAEEGAKEPEHLRSH